MNENVKDGNQQVSIQEQQATQLDRKQSKGNRYEIGLNIARINHMWVY